MATRKAKSTHEFNTKMNLREYLRQFFGMPKILNPHTKLLPKLGKLCRRSNEGWRCTHEWADAYTITPEFEYFYNRVSICCQNRDSVRPALTSFNLISHISQYHHFLSILNVHIYIHHLYQSLALKDNKWTILISSQIIITFIRSLREKKNQNGRQNYLRCPKLSLISSNLRS